MNIYNDFIRLRREYEPGSIKYWESVVDKVLNEMNNEKELVEEFKKYSVDELKKELARREQDALDNELEALREWANDSLLPAMNNAGVESIRMRVHRNSIAILKNGDNR